MGVMSVPGAAVEPLRNTGSFMTPEPTGFFEVGIESRLLRIRPPQHYKKAIPAGLRSQLRVRSGAKATTGFFWPEKWFCWLEKAVHRQKRPFVSLRKDFSGGSWGFSSEK
jgi:hypothetical protein